MGIVLVPKEYSLINTGSYRATVSSIEEAEGKFGAQCRWCFDLGEIEDVDGKVEPRTLVAYTGQTLSPKAKLWGWVQACGLDPSDGLDSDDLIGRQVILDVVIQPTSDGESTFNQIHALRRPKAKANGVDPKPAAKPKPAEDFDDGSEL